MKSLSVNLETKDHRERLRYLRILSTLVEESDVSIDYSPMSANEPHESTCREETQEVTDQIQIPQLLSAELIS